jgi:hypothetical protein
MGWETDLPASDILQGNFRFTFSIRSLILQSLFLMGNFYESNLQAFIQNG